MRWKWRSNSTFIAAFIPAQLNDVKSFYWQCLADLLVYGKPKTNHNLNQPC
jgi:hypothetical protein